MNIGELRQRQGLPLELKIQKSIRTIEEFYERTDGMCYISTGGADSTVLRWLARQSRYPDIEAVCVASVEPVGNIKHNFECGDTLLKSPYTKRQVITEYGYPIISKEFAMSISRYTRTKSPAVRSMRINGYITKDFKVSKIGTIPKCYLWCLEAPFEFSEQCCNKTKKLPLNTYSKQSNKHPITGEMADESHKREREYLKHGCIMFDKKEIKCTPLGFWLKQDIPKCIHENNIPISCEYGEPILVNGVWQFTGEQRTGCDICAFGIKFDPNRFDRLKENKPNLYRKMMEGGQWIKKERYRFVRFEPGSPAVLSNLYWVPSNEGYGYRYVLNYYFKAMGINKFIK